MENLPHMSDFRPTGNQPSLSLRHPFYMLISFISHPSTMPSFRLVFFFFFSRKPVLHYSDVSRHCLSDWIFELLFWQHVYTQCSGNSLFASWNLYLDPYIFRWASQVAQGKRIHLPVQKTWETWVWSLGLEDPLEEKMAAHSSILAGIIPWTEEPGGLQSMGLQRIRYDWAIEHNSWQHAFSGRFYVCEPSIPFFIIKNYSI